jgi:ABC-type nickel/cobalt efflux system permease component RcnA
MAPRQGSEAPQRRQSLSQAQSNVQNLSRLLDGAPGVSWVGLLIVAAGLGAVHAVQPGHGKTLVSAIALGPDVSWYQPALLGVVATLAHTGSVLFVAAALWVTGATQVADLQRGLIQLTGFAIAAGGLWRLGRHLGEWGFHSHEYQFEPGKLAPGALISLGVAGGLVPCWEAVSLVVLSAAIGRLGIGVLLVVAFGTGMACVLVGVGLTAVRLKSKFLSATTNRWESHLALASAAILTTIGLVLFLS